MALVFSIWGSYRFLSSTHPRSFALIGETKQVDATPTWTGVKAGESKASPKAGAKKVAAPKKKFF